MLIVSSFSDYYDFMQKTGVDKTCVYNRETTVNPINYYLPKSDRYFAALGIDVKVEWLIIGVCHEVHRAVAINDRVCYSLDEADVVVAGKPFSDKAREIYNQSYPYYKRNRYLTRKELRRWFNSTDYVIPPHYHESVPVWVAQGGRNRREGGFITLNPQLLSLGFQRIKDPVSVYQEISMYLIGLGGDNKVPPIDDRTLAEAKGFDKWSFRREPSR